MNKPITILKQEFDQNLVNLINDSGNSGLPACVMKPSVANLLQLLDQLEQRQLEADQQAYAEEQAREEVAPDES